MTTYDLQRRITMKGTVARFDFANPHVLLYFDVKDVNGTVVPWVGETGSPNMMRRDGCKNGSPSMRFLKAYTRPWSGQKIFRADNFLWKEPGWSYT